MLHVGDEAMFDALVGLPVVFHPYFGSLDPDRLAGDELLHDGVRARMTAGAELLPVGTTRPRPPSPAARRCS